jgi:SAM-dependent methyltransferase
MSSFCIAVPTRNRLNRVQRFVDSLVKTTKKDNRPELLFIHDSPTSNDSVNYTSKLPNTSTLVFSEKNGLTKLWNQCIIKSNEEWVLVCNDDAVFKNGWYEYLTEQINSGKFLQINLLHYGGFCIHRKMILRNGWFDENFKGGGYEDVDWQVRVTESDSNYLLDYSKDFTLLDHGKFDDGTNWLEKNNRHYMEQKWNKNHKSWLKQKIEPSFRKLPEIDWYPRITAMWSKYYGEESQIPQINKGINTGKPLFVHSHLKKMKKTKIEDKKTPTKICGFLQTYNGLEHGDIQRCITNLKKFCDYIVVYDDASTDGTGDYCRENGCDVLSSEDNHFLNETQNKQKLLEFALNLHDDIDWFFWLDDDEILDKNGCDNIKDFLSSSKFDSHSFTELNLWRSNCWERLDYLGRGKFSRAWRNNGYLYFPKSYGLHKCVVPDGRHGGESAAPFNVIHYGYSSQERIEQRWIERNALGVPLTLSGRNNQFDETKAKFEKIPDDLFPEEISFDPEPNPPAPAVWSDRVYEDLRYGMKENYVIQMTLTQRRSHLNTVVFKEIYEAGHIKEDTLFVGCNQGSSLVMLAPYCKNLTGLDINHASLQVARKHLDDTDNHHVKLICRNLTHYEEEQKYDCIIAFQVMEHIYPKDINKVLEKIDNALKPNGVFIVEVPHPNAHYYTEPNHVSHFDSEQKIHDVFGTKFKVIDIVHETRENPGPDLEGKHNDWRFICQKL